MQAKSNSSFKNNFSYMLKNWLKWDKKSPFYFIVRVPALVIQPIITAYIPKAMIDCINAGVSEKRLILIVGLLSLVFTLTIWLDPFMSELVRGGARIVRMRYAVAAFNKNLNTDYVNIENLENREKQKRAEMFYNGRWSAGSDFVNLCNDFCIAILGVITSAFLIYKINILMILLILATCIIQFFALRYIIKLQKKNLDGRSKIYQKFDYFYMLSKDGESAKDVRFYAFKDYFVKCLADLLLKLEKTASKYLHQSVAYNGITALMNLIRLSVAYAYLVYLVVKNQLSVSDFVFYFGIITGFSNWVVNLVFSSNQLKRCSMECQAYRDYIETPDYDDAGDSLNSSCVETLEFKNVSFKYPNAEDYTLKNINLKFTKGENVAVVGENGAGKTTLIKLVCGLYKPSKGSVLLNDRDVSNISKSSYFDLFGTVFQDFYFLPMTVAQNVCACNDYDENRLFAALKKAGIYEKIMALPDKERSFIDKEVYKNAVDFSGGEKQKLLLAKAIYKDAPILILDEPTAALDPIAENELYLKYSELTRGKLSFFISHRLSSTRFCDRILFVKNGKIVEQGTHNELMALKGYYYKMYQIQSYYYKEQGVAIYE